MKTRASLLKEVEMKRNYIYIYIYIYEIKKKIALQSPSLLGTVTEALTQTSRGEDIVILSFLRPPLTPFTPPRLVINLLLEPRCLIVDERAEAVGDIFTLDIAICSPLLCTDFAFPMRPPSTA